jgi:hypothetical protein
MADGSSGPYNGSDEAASKAAGHDLKGTTHYYTAGIKRLCLPLMALIDYKGFRMTAQAFLPLGKQSLVYGSADAGRTVLKSNPDFNDAMVESARKLNLRGHCVGSLGQQQELYSAVDIGTSLPNILFVYVLTHLSLHPSQFRGSYRYGRSVLSPRSLPIFSARGTHCCQTHGRYIRRWFNCAG